MKLSANEEYGLRCLGFVEVQAPHPPGLQPVLGRVAELETLVERTRCEVLIVADVGDAESELTELVRRPGCMRCEVWVVPRPREFHVHGGVPDHIGAIPVIRTRRATLTGPVVTCRP